jgi:hypothetical protein
VELEDDPEFRQLAEQVGIGTDAWKKAGHRTTVKFGKLPRAARTSTNLDLFDEMFKVELRRELEYRPGQRIRRWWNQLWKP